MNNDTDIVQYFRECFQNYLSTPDKQQTAFKKTSAFHSVIIMHFPLLVPFLCWLSKYWILANQVIRVESLYCWFESSLFWERWVGTQFIKMPLVLN